MRSIYLDYNTTTPVAPRVRDAMRPFLDEYYGHPGSIHFLGRAVAEALQDARHRVARLLGVDPTEIFFTSGGTESTNWAIRGVAERVAGDGSGHIITTELEHAAVRGPIQYLESIGYDVTFVRSDSSGHVDPHVIEEALRDDTFLVSVMHANHEIGTIQPLRQIARICHMRGVLLHTNAAQSVGKIVVRPRDLEVDLLSLSGHKMYAPKGIGALYVRRGAPIEPLLHGAGEEGGLRSGTENVACAVALGAAAQLAEADFENETHRIKGLCDRLGDQLRRAIPEAIFHGGEVGDRLPNTLCIGFPVANADEMLRRIPELCASTCASCQGVTTDVSPTLAAIGVDTPLAQGTIRLSLGRYTTEEDIDRAADLLIASWESVRY